jgi:hypothetical protein
MKNVEINNSERKLSEFFKSLSGGDIRTALSLRNEIVSGSNDESISFETEEMLRQAIMNHLVRGSIETAILIKNNFNISDGSVDEIAKQAVLSSFYDGNIKRVKEIKDKFSVSRSVIDGVIEYCISWGEVGNVSIVRSIFSIPA